MTITTASSVVTLNDALGQKAGLFQAVPQAEWVDIASDDLGLDLNAAKFQIAQLAAARIIDRAGGRELSHIELAAVNALRLLSFSDGLCAGICRSVDGLGTDSKNRVGLGLRKALPALREEVDGLFFMPSDWRLYDDMLVIYALPNLERDTIPTFVHTFAGKQLRLHNWPIPSRIELRSYSTMLTRITAEVLAQFWASEVDLKALVAEGSAILAQETEAPERVRSGGTTLCCEITAPAVAAVLLLARAALWSGARADGNTIRAAIQNIAERSSMVQRMPGAEAAVRLACCLGEVVASKAGCQDLS